MWKINIPMANHRCDGTTRRRKNKKRTGNSRFRGIRRRVGCPYLAHCKLAERYIHPELLSKKCAFNLDGFSRSIPTQVERRSPSLLLLSLPRL
ncbi:hypothetical protein GWI33_018782 [Rhynchophorus ferrugineus]|uniref:Uncharacterized protein n=1 Tax=Rhynchophorus ferrugineus TaxID=354439 RepID=A0A834HVN4_RHYFE|nr:hypothetical protein GWI33_018782 [Rhynchophorus ferrugineus]